MISCRWSNADAAKTADHWRLWRRNPAPWIALLLALLLADAARAGRPRYADPNDLGPFCVGHTVVDLVDAARGDRPLRTEIWYPVDPEDAVGVPTFYDFQFFGLGLTSPIAIEDAEPAVSAYLPLVVFSHGNCGVSWQSTPLMEMLASHGMMVIAPNHTGNSVNQCVGTANPDPVEVAARNRPLDVSFLIDLMLARSATRVGEMAVRLSLGASPRRLAALLFTEAALASLLAALASLPLAMLMVRWAGSMVPAYGAASVDVALNAELVGIAVAAALVSAAAFSMYPVLKLSATRPGQPVRAQGLHSIGGRTTSRFRTTLVTAQVAMATMLLVLAGLLAQSLANVSRTDLGLRTESLLSFSISPERNGYARQGSVTLLDSVERDVAAIPGVTSVSSALVPLLAGTSVTRNVRIPGFDPAAGTLPLAHFNGVSKGFFETLGIPGRFQIAPVAADDPLA